MKLEGRIRLDMTDIKQAIAEYVQRTQQLTTKISAEKVNLYPVESPDWGFFASLDVEVAIIGTD